MAAHSAPMRTRSWTHLARRWSVPWTLFALTAYAATALGAWQHAGVLFPTDSYPGERFLRASAAWPMVAALSVLVAVPLAAISLVLHGRARFALVLVMAVGLASVGLAAGGIFIHIGTPGPGDPAIL